MKRVPFILRRGVAAALLSCLVASAGAADITIKNAWTRPARANTAAGGVYFDVVTNVPLKLLGATSPVAKSVAIVLVEQKPDGTSVDNLDVVGDIGGFREHDRRRAVLVLRQLDRALDLTRI